MLCFIYLNNVSGFGTGSGKGHCTLDCDFGPEMLYIFSWGTLLCELHVSSAMESAALLFCNGLGALRILLWLIDKAVEHSSNAKAADAFASHRHLSDPITFTCSLYLHHQTQPLEKRGRISLTTPAEEWPALRLV